MFDVSCFNLNHCIRLKSTPMIVGVPLTNFPTSKKSIRLGFTLSHKCYLTDETERQADAFSLSSPLIDSGVQCNPSLCDSITNPGVAQIVMQIIKVAIFLTVFKLRFSAFSLDNSVTNQA